MLFFKTMLAIMMAGIIYAPSTLAVQCQVLCKSQNPLDVCGNQRAAASRIRLNNRTGSSDMTQVLIARTIATRYEVAAHFDTRKITFTTIGGPDGTFLFDINFGGAGSRTYKLSAQDDACEQDIPAGATTLSGNAINVAGG
jgi:hypothetical protein